LIDLGVEKQLAEAVHEKEQVEGAKESFANAIL
jgi:hypothetical protein